MEELAVDVHHLPGALHHVRDAARRLEDNGFTGIFFPEALGYSGDSLHAMQLAADATQHLKMGTVVSNIYLRNAALTAVSVSGINELSGGRVSVGLGVGHKLFNEPFGVKAGKPLSDMREYVQMMRKHVYGDPVPEIFVAALRSNMTRLAGEIADGVMLYMVPLSRLPSSIATARSGASVRPTGSQLRIAALVQVVVDDDLTRARLTAKKSLAAHLSMEYYRSVLREFGFVDLSDRASEVWGARADSSLEDTLAANPAGAGTAAVDTAALIELISDDMAEELFVLGSPTRCRQGLERYREAGVDLPILLPWGFESQDKVFLGVVEAFART